MSVFCPCGISGGSFLARCFVSKLSNRADTFAENTNSSSKGKKHEPDSIQSSRSGALFDQDIPSPFRRHIRADPETRLPGQHQMRKPRRPTHGSPDGRRADSARRTLILLPQGCAPPIRPTYQSGSNGRGSWWSARCQDRSAACNAPPRRSTQIGAMVMDHNHLIAPTMGSGGCERLVRLG